MNAVATELRYGMPSLEAWQRIADIAKDVRVPKRTRLRALNMIVSRTDPVMTVLPSTAPVNIAFVVQGESPKALEDKGVLALTSDNVRYGEEKKDPPAPGTPMNGVGTRGAQGTLSPISSDSPPTNPPESGVSG